MAENNSIESIRPPFSAYDFFGHLIPGLTFFVCLYVFESGVFEFEAKATQLKPDAFSWKYLLHWLLTQAQPAGAEGALRYAGFMGVATLFVYAFSHVISSISSFFIDRLLIYKGFGYPYRFLLLGENDKTLSYSEDIKRHYYRGIFFWGNFCVLVTFFVRAFLDSFLTGFVSWCLVVGTWLMFFFIPIIIRCLVGSLHHARVKKKGQKQQSVWQKAFSWLRIETETENAKDLFRRLTRAFAWGFTVPSHPIQQILHTDRPLEKPVADKYRAAFRQQLKLNPDEAESSNYWFSLFYVTEHSPRFSKLISNWFYQYSFARNMATAFYLAFVVCVGFVSFSFASVHTLPDSERIWLRIMPLAFFLMALFMLIRFYYIYVAYYSRSLYRAFVFLQQEEQSNPTRKGKGAEDAGDE